MRSFIPQMFSYSLPSLTFSLVFFSVCLSFLSLPLSRTQASICQTCSFSLPPSAGSIQRSAVFSFSSCRDLRPASRSDGSRATISLNWGNVNRALTQDRTWPVTVVKYTINDCWIQLLSFQGNGAAHCHTVMVYWAPHAWPFIPAASVLVLQREVKVKTKYFHLPCNRQDC